MTLTDAPPPAETAPSERRVALVAMIAHARSVPSVEREAFAQELAALGEGPGHVVVHTCHRVELYVAPGTEWGDLPELPVGGQRLDDAAAVRHLISVACGLDSAVFGETQILHQVRAIIAERQAERALDPTLDRLFQAALRAGRTARGWFSGSPRSLADVALDRIEQVAGPLGGRRILVVGVGRMGRLAAFAAMRRSCAVTVSNRNQERAAQLAHEVGGSTIPFGQDDSLDSLDSLDGIVTAIGGPWAVGPRDTRRLVDRALPVVDLSSPPAVPEAITRGLGARFVSVDALAEGDHGPGERVRRRLERLISETGREYCRWIRSRDAVPAIHAVVDVAELHRRAELDWLQRRLPNLTPSDLGIVEQMSHRLVAAMLHAPLAALNEDSSGDLEHAARELFGV